MELGLHLPQLDLDGRGFSLARLTGAARAADQAGFSAVSANDHLVFPAPWLDAVVALSAVLEASGSLELWTTIAVPALRHPVPLAKALSGLDELSGGRVVAGIGAGSSRADFEAVGLDPDERWRRFDDAAAALRGLVDVPLWIASWGSPAGLRRVQRYGDGWLASAYNTDPEAFGRARAAMALPSALATMWTWVTEDDADARRRREELGRLLGRDLPADRLCIGSRAHCAELLAAYAEAGCDRVHVWPLGEEQRQIELIAETMR